MTPSAENKTSRAQQKQVTRQLILKTAKKLFLKLGYEKTTMRKIAEAAGLGIGTTFMHYPDKPSLLAATLHQDIEDVLEKAYVSLPPNSSLVDMLAHPVSAIFRHFAKTPELSKTWIRETLFLKGPWGERVDALFVRSTDHVRLVLQDAQAMGRLDPDIDCNVLASGMLSHYLSTLIYGLKNGLDAETQVSMYKALINSQLRPLPGEDQ